MVPVTSDYSPSAVYFDKIRINDMELYKGRVYLCGYIEEENGRKAMIGYFNLSGFPNIDIKYYKMDNCKEFKKLDIYTIEEIIGFPEVHLVTTGTTSGSRTDALVDLNMHATGSWNCSVHISSDENENYDDIAVTKQYVVVSSRNKIQNIPVVYLWYYKRPNHIWEDIFTSNADRFLVYNPVAESPVILEHMTADSFAAVYKIDGFSNMAMLTMDVASPNYKVFEIVGNQDQASIPMDIKYKSPRSVFSILARNGNVHENRFIPPMQIFHVTPEDLQGLTLAGQGRDYLEILYKLWSLDSWKGPATRFVVSGGSSQLPALFRFNHYQWNYCSHRFEYRYSNGTLKGDTVSIPVSYYSDYLKVKNKEKRNIATVPFPVECGSELNK